MVGDVAMETDALLLGRDGAAWFQGEALIPLTKPLGKGVLVSKLQILPNPSWRPGSRLCKACFSLPTSHLP